MLSCQTDHRLIGVEVELLAKHEQGRPEDDNQDHRDVDDQPLAPEGLHAPR
jgi:hypothetical protein